MREMRVVVVSFDRGGDKYGRLARVFLRSVNSKMPGTEVTFHQIPPPPVPDVVKKTRPSAHAAWLVANSVKLAKWVEELEKGDSPIMFSDCDMLMVQPVDDVWKMDFDVAFTRRDENDATIPQPKGVEVVKPSKRVPPATGFARVPLNGGIVFARPTDVTRRFFRTWLEINDRMLMDVKFHAPWKKKYLGVNQASLGYMLENGSSQGVRLVSLPCSVWNACESNWLRLDPDVRMVHVKGMLRHYCLRARPTPMTYKRVVDMWTAYERKG